MEPANKVEELAVRRAPIEIEPEEFRALGHTLVDRIADFLTTLAERPVTTGETPSALRQVLGTGSLPEHGAEPRLLLEEAATLLFDHSLFNSHPRFFGFITAPAAPIGILGDLLAAAVNPNVGGWVLSPMATEIERQTVRWIAEMIGFPSDCGGLLVSGGNMANFVCFLAARRAKAGWDVRVDGMAGSQGRTLRVYASKETHTWIQKAADLYGLGTGSIRWIPTGDDLRMDIAALQRQIEEDKAQGDQPFLVVGTGGSVSTGAVDPLPELAAICREHDLWFHVDGAYGGFAAVLPDCPPDLKALSEADSIAIDPHKWLYAPLEAGCALVRRPQALTDAFSYHPPYYYMAQADEEAPLNYHEYGPQNSRGFRALKVWLALRHVGREGYIRMLSDDIALAQELYRLADAHHELHAFTHDLSIATFRYVPTNLTPGAPEIEEYLNKLNTTLLERLQGGGEAFLSNAILDGKFLLRACVVNFRTSMADIQALPGIIVRLGAEVDAALRPSTLGR